MHIVLENSPRRNSLLISPVIDRPGEDTDDISYTIQLYPNPATDRLYISTDKKFWGNNVSVTAHTLLGKVVFSKTFKITKSGLEIPVSEACEKIIILSVEGSGLCHRQLVMIN